MSNDYSAEELMSFLDHLADRGLMPVASAKALAVSSRKILEILNDEERSDLRRLDAAAVVSRFGNRRAKDFNPASLKEYGRRFQRAVALFLQWRADPTAFSVRTRPAGAARNRSRAASHANHAADMAVREQGDAPLPPAAGDGRSYQSSFPVRPGVVVTISNIPPDLSKTEAERLAQFVRMLTTE